MSIPSLITLINFFSKVIEEVKEVKNLNIKFAYKIREFDKLIVIDCKEKNVKEGTLNEKVDVLLELDYETFKNLYTANLDVMFALNKKLLIPTGNVKYVMQVVKTIPISKEIFKEILKE